MVELDTIATQVSNGLATTLSRIKSLIAAVGVVAFLVGAATFLTGLWAFDNGRLGWAVIGGVLCLIPVGAALIGWFMVHTTAEAAPQLLDDVRVLLKDSHQAAAVLIDHDTGQRLGTSAKTFQTLRTDLKVRRKELPALFAGVRAITSVPGLAAVTLFGIAMIGCLGMILVVGKLLS
jgi:hypothetical protein